MLLPLFLLAVPLQLFHGSLSNDLVQPRILDGNPLLGVFALVDVAAVANLLPPMPVVAQLAERGNEIKTPLTLQPHMGSLHCCIPAPQGRALSRLPVHFHQLQDPRGAQWGAVKLGPDNVAHAPLRGRRFVLAGGGLGARAGTYAVPFSLTKATHNGATLSGIGQDTL